MVGATKWEGAGTALLACGYGVTCGLVFPLMVQSVFLHEIGLAHGAGESFGLLFFIAYSVTMLACAALLGLAAGSGNGRTPLLAGLAAAFAGNALMLAHSFGLVADGWPYAVAAASLIGCGLALGELGFTSQRRGFPVSMRAVTARAASLARAIPARARLSALARSWPVLQLATPWARKQAD